MAMTIRNPNNFSNWEFFIQAPDGEEVKLKSSTLYKLTDLVIQQINVWDSETPGFSDGARQEARDIGLTWYDYIKYSIQNQLCVRHNGVVTGLCWNDKLGSKLLYYSKSIDSKVESLPKPLKKIAELATQAATLIATGKPEKKLGSCQVCGGRRTFQGSNNNNNGRASKLDKPSS